MRFDKFDSTTTDSWEKSKAQNNNRNNKQKTAFRFGEIIGILYRLVKFDEMGDWIVSNYIKTTNTLKQIVLRWNYIFSIKIYNCVVFEWCKAADTEYRRIGDEKSIDLCGAQPSEGEMKIIASRLEQKWKISTD